MHRGAQTSIGADITLRLWLARLCMGRRDASSRKEHLMATSKKTSSRGRAQDRARVAGNQEHEVRYASKKTGKPAAAVKAAVKSEGNSRKKVEKKLAE